jgi:hypothetical protein
MLCDECGDVMQRETVVLVTRIRGRNRSELQPGWYCWGCKTSAHSAGDLLPVAVRRRGARSASTSSVTPAPGNWFAGLARGSRGTSAGRQTAS